MGHKNEATLRLEEVDLVTFRRNPVGCFVRSEHVVHYWFSRSLVGWIIAGHVERRDVDLIAACAKLAEPTTPFCSLFDARLQKAVPPREFARWFGILLRYIVRVRRSLRAVAGILPGELEARAAFHGVMTMARAPWRNHLVRSVAEGLTCLGVSDVAQHEHEVLRLTQLLAGGPARAPDAGLALTNRERHIAELVAQGLSDLNIAEILAISESTVGSHLTRIYRKLAVHSRVDLVNRLGG